MAKADHITAQQVRDLLIYDQETGQFAWRVDRYRTTKAGSPAGHANKRGRVTIWVNNSNLEAGRVAWLYMTGSWPTGEIDHINGDSLDNRFSNLRDVDHKTNMENRRSKSRNNRSGYLGVCKYKNRYLANVVVNYKRILVGRFDSPEEAHKAYLEAKRRLHDGCTI